MELNFKTAALKKLVVHYVGSKNNLDPLVLSNQSLSLEEEQLSFIGESFLHKFNSLFDWHSFHHPSSLQYNEVYNYVKEVFENNDMLEDASIRIAKHLYENSTHPKVKGGELYVGFFDGLPIEGRMHKAVGIFKTENKAVFLDVQNINNELQLDMREGVELTKVDKGCLVINDKTGEGFDVLLFDNQNRGEEAVYWKEKFLGLQPQKNEFHQTSHFLTLTKQYITEQAETEFGLPKKEQIELLHKSIDYFRSKESFISVNFKTKCLARKK